MGDFGFIAAIVLGVLLGPWLLVWRVNSRRKRERLEDQEHWRELTSRTFSLEETVRALQAERASPASKETPPRTSQSPVATSYTPPFPNSNIVTPSLAPPVVAPVPAQRVAEQWPTHEPIETPTPSSSTSSTTDRPTSPLATPVAPPPSPNFHSVESGPSLADRFKSSLDVEEMLGTNWLNKLGIVILVLGIAFFLAYQLKTVGPAGKVLVGFVTAVVMLGAGIWFDRRERYRILARAGIGGGWALLFFTTYAMYHVAAAQVLSSHTVAL